MANIVVQDLKDDKIKQLIGENSDGMKPKQWRLMPTHCFNDVDITHWQIFQLDDDQIVPDGGDIIPVNDNIEFWDGVRIVLEHNKALGFYK